jgi:hypothetical protein
MFSKSSTGSALIRPDPRLQPFTQDPGRGRRQLRAGERADGSLGALAGGRVVQGGQESHELPGQPERGRM